jgi:hypothetical protein
VAVARERKIKITFLQAAERLGGGKDGRAM